MRLSGKRRLGSLAFGLLLALGMPACSGQQQGEEQMEVTDEEGNQANESGDEYAEEGNEETDNAAEGENVAEGEEGANEYAEGGNEYAEGGNEYAEGGNAYGEGQEVAEGNATENDLQEIIQEMNGQQAEGGDAYEAQALAQDPAMPVDTAAMNTTTPEAMPMEAAPAAPAMPAAPATEVSSTTAPFQPGGSPAGQGLPEMGSKMAYIVQSGDTLGKISAKIYGDMNRWKEMADLSGLANPSRIYPGDVVYYTLDEQALAFATAYESIQRAEETVQPGDTLATIAQRVYGSSSSWKSIWRQNDNINNPDVVTPGSTVYYIPSAALTAAVSKAKAELAKVAQVSAQGILLANGHAHNVVASVANLN